MASPTTKTSRGKTDSPAKRGRGRPRSPNPLSAAERARRYRLKKKQGKTGKTATPAKEGIALTPENFALLLQQNAELRQDLADMISAVELFIGYRQSKKAMPLDIFRNLCQSHLKIVARSR